MTTCEERKKIFDALPKMALSPQHVSGAKLIESRLAMLDKLPKGMRVLEVGVANGGFSVEIWKRISPVYMSLVDLWEGDRYSQGYNKVKEIFSKNIADGTVSLNISSSIDFLKNCSENSFDFIYIDTNHTYWTTIEELVESDRIISRDGFIAGHDYTVGNTINPMVYGVIQAVNQFCVENHYKFEYLTVEPAGWNSFCLKRI